MLSVAVVPAVQVHFDQGETELAPLKNDAHLYNNRKFPIHNVPQELNGLTFTRRPGGTLARLTLTAPTGSTVYLIVDSDRSANADLPGVKELNLSLAKSGWERLSDARFVGAAKARENFLSVYKRQFSKNEVIKLDTVGFSGVTVVASNLVLDGTQAAPSPMTVTTEAPAAPAAPTAPAPAVALSTPPQPPVSTRRQVVRDKEPDLTPIAKPQSTIKSLYVVTEDSGRMLGVASDLIVTATPGESHGFTPVSFTTDAGREMHLVLDDVLRSIHVRYPRWGASRVELSFEDKYSPKDGGSIGAAIGTLLLSMLQGFDIDPKVAITGDVSADGRVHRVGGIAAKLRGAQSAGCTILAMPEDNLPQLTDAVVYDGPDSVIGMQVIGISTLDTAAATVRIDRDPKLAEAISTFKQVQAALHTSRASIHSKAVQEQLNIVLADCPNHYSAQLLMLLAANKLPQKLSPSASVYYTVIAMQGVEPALYERGQARDRHVTPAAVQEALKALQKVRGVADTDTLPLIDAERMFVGALGQEAGGKPNHDLTEARRQAVLDALQRLQADRDLVEKMLHGGV